MRTLLALVTTLCLAHTTEAQAAPQVVNNSVGTYTAPTPQHDPAAVRAPVPTPDNVARAAWLQALLAERARLQTTSHRTGGPAFLTILGITGVLGGLSLWAMTPLLHWEDDSLERRQDTRVFTGAVGAMMFVPGLAMALGGIIRWRTKINRRRQQAARLRELDAELSQLSVSLSPGQLSLRW